MACVNCKWNCADLPEELAIEQGEKKKDCCKSYKKGRRCRKCPKK